MADYRMFRRQLDHAYQPLDNRHERFQRKLLDGFQRCRRGEPDCERESQIERRHFEETREMTRKIISAEKQLTDKKDELYRNGIQAPGSDLESGFLDDVDDGYTDSGAGDDEAEYGHDDPKISEVAESGGSVYEYAGFSAWRSGSLACQGDGNMGEREHDR